MQNLLQARATPPYAPGMATNQSAVEKAVEAAGGPVALARAVGTKPGNVYYWRRSGKISPPYVIPVEEATGVPRHDLRPDIYPPS